MCISIILTRFFSPYIPLFGSSSFRLGIGTLPLMMIGIYFGPIYGFVCGFLADLIGAFLFPVGAYIFWYSLSSSLYGIIAWLVYFSTKKIKASIYIINSLLLVTFVTCLVYSLVLTNEFKVGAFKFVVNRQSISLAVVISIVFFIALFLSVYFLQAKKQNRYSSFIFINNFIVILACEILILSVFGAFIKEQVFSIKFNLGFLSSLLFLPVNLIIKTLVLNYLVNLTTPLFSNESKKATRFISSSQLRLVSLKYN